MAEICTFKLPRVPPLGYHFPRYPRLVTFKSFLPNNDSQKCYIDLLYCKICDACTKTSTGMHWFLKAQVVGYDSPPICVTFCIHWFYTVTGTPRTCVLLRIIIAVFNVIFSSRSRQKENGIHVSLKSGIIITDLHCQ